MTRPLRAGCLDLLDLEHIAEEIEDVGKSERREIVRAVERNRGRRTLSCGWVILR